MIINYDHSPALTVDMKLQSLVENIQLMNDEIAIRLEKVEAEIKEIKEKD